MKAPGCSLCHRDCLHTPYPAELVRFRDYEPLPDGCPGHPRGLEWFCQDHAPAARELSHLDFATALAMLKKRFGAPPAELSKRSWWRRLFG